MFAMTKLDIATLQGSAFAPMPYWLSLFADLSARSSRHDAAPGDPRRRAA
jgi:hypothetical protein